MSAAELADAVFEALVRGEVDVGLCEVRPAGLTPDGVLLLLRTAAAGRDELRRARGCVRF